MSSPQTRRAFLKALFTCFPAGLSAGLLVMGCTREKSSREDEDAGPVASAESCSDLSGVSDTEIEKREVYGYTEESYNSENLCSNCNLYLPPKEGEPCGGCLLFEGPVHAGGYCDYWVAEA